MYCDRIPLDLAGELLCKGVIVSYSYAAVFDWFAKKGLIIVIQPCWDFADERIIDEWESDIVRVGAFSSQPNVTPTHHNTWNEAANEAIEKALELIKEEKIILAETITSMSAKETRI